MKLDLNKIILEAQIMGYKFSLLDAEDVINSKPSWFTDQETEAEAVADYINAFGG